MPIESSEEDARARAYQAIDVGDARSDVEVDEARYAAVLRRRLPEDAAERLAAYADRLPVLQELTIGDPLVARWELFELPEESMRLELADDPTYGTIVCTLPHGVAWQGRFTFMRPHGQDDTTTVMVADHSPDGTKGAMRQPTITRTMRSWAVQRSTRDSHQELRLFAAPELHAACPWIDPESKQSSSLCVTQ
jgi:hypothetical protein